ncbi:MAG: site-2 protease family protein [Lentisphaeria bacterium]|nr:site-2 protease family protein [Lentisphaeria bacterium]
MAVFDHAWKVLFVLVFFGLCIFVHELGHLLVGLWRGLHAERFSVGFGKKIWGRTYRGVEYVISILPFGGYVALPQLEPADVPTDSAGNPLPKASPGNRALTAAAGPVANLLFGFLLAAVAWAYGVYEPAPASSCTVWEVPEVLPLYRDGLKPSDTVVAVDGKPVRGTWIEVAAGLTREDREVRLTVRRKGETLDLTYHPEPNPEYVAGLRPLDRIVAVNGQTFSKGWEEMSERIVLNTDELTLTLEGEDGQRRQIAYAPAKNPLAEGLGYPFFSVVHPTEVAHVQPGSPAQDAGFRKGDRLLAVNGTRIPDQGVFVDEVERSAGGPMQVTVLRDGREMVVEVRAQAAQEKGRTIYRVGLALQGPKVIGHPDPWTQFTDIFLRTKRILGSIFAPVRGRKSLVRVGHMSGPVGILGMIWYRLDTEGLRGGLSIIILVTFSLAFFNLLPIPVLDGGHILYSLVEVVIRRHLPTRLVHGLQYTFAYLLIALMLYITFRDVLRVPRFWRAFRGGEDTEEAAGPNPPLPQAAEDGTGADTVPAAAPAP